MYWKKVFCHKGLLILGSILFSICIAFFYIVYDTEKYIEPTSKVVIGLTMFAILGLCLGGAFIVFGFIELNNYLTWKKLNEHI